MKTRTPMLAAALAVLLLAVAAVTSGCGSTSGQDDGVAALDDSPATTTNDEEQDSAAEEDDPQEAALEWAACMREHGVDVPDPEVGEDGRLEIRPGAGAGRRLDDVDSGAFREAMRECGRPLGGTGPPALSDEEREDMQEAMLAFARCMRENGVDMPDPEFSGEGGGGLFRFRAGGANGPSPDSATFRKAEEACRDILEEAMPRRPGQADEGDAE